MCSCKEGTIVIILTQLSRRNCRDEMHRKKISLIGSGNIGGMLAYMAGFRNLGDVVLVDVAEGIPQGKALDIAQAGAVDSFGMGMMGTNDYSMISGSDVIIVTAGIARKPGMSREDLVNTNSKIMTQVGAMIKQYAPGAFVIVLTNPLDIMAWVLKRESGISANKIVGMAGVLDTARFKLFLAQELNVSMEDIQSIVLGGHGDTMVPMLRYTTVCGIPLSEIVSMGWITDDRVQELVTRTQNGGGEIVGLLKTGSAYCAPAASALSMAESYLLGKRRVMPISMYMNGDYGLKDMYFGVPAVIGPDGVERMIHLDLNDEEMNMLNKSAKVILDTMKIVR